MRNRRKAGKEEARGSNKMMRQEKRKNTRMERKYRRVGQRKAGPALQW